jgi:hypothetical protein
MTTASYFRSQAQKCRTLADATVDDRTAKVLRQMALEFEHKAEFLAIEQGGDEGPAAQRE